MRGEEWLSSATWLVWRGPIWLLALVMVPVIAALGGPGPAMTIAPPEALAVGPVRIGLQAGHWRSNELPDELAGLRRQTGGSGGGVREVDVTVAVAHQLADRLRARGYEVDVLPATVPPGYRADLFLAIHADAVTSPVPRGFKLARYRLSRLPATEDAAIAILREEYARATGLPWSYAITRNMTGYYAFNSTRWRHAIHPATPGIIFELGYLTNGADRALLTGGMRQVLDGLTAGITRFVEGLPPPEARERPLAGPPVSCRSFPETDQDLCGPFRRAWEERGGLARFGLPISAEFVEPDRFTGAKRTVQYFERARLDLVAEALGTPDEIQVGLLGYIVAAGREQAAPFARITPFPDDDDRRYFPESGHSLAGGFKQFWTANDGLRAFGFPLSEEFQETDPTTGVTLTVQYFERARLEYHPAAAGTPAAIQIGHLGREAYRLGNASGP